MSFVLLVRRWALCGALAAVVALAAASSAAAAGGQPVWGSSTPYTALPSNTGTALFNSVSCASVGNCVAVGLSDGLPGVPDGLVAAEASGTWGPATSVLPPNAGSFQGDLLTSVSCSSAGSCEAVGSSVGGTDGNQALVLPIAVSGQTATPGTGIEVTLPAGAESNAAQSASLNGVSCQGAGGCVAVGEYMDSAGDWQGMVATPGSGGAWTATELSQLPSNANSNPVARLNSVSCPTSGACEAVGSYVDSAGDQQPLAVTVSNGAPDQATEVGLPRDYSPSTSTGTFSTGDEATTLAAVSCPSAGTCTASGTYSSTDGPTTGLSAVAIPINDGTPGTAVELQPPAGASIVSPVEGATSISCTDAEDCSLVGYVGTAASAVTPPTMLSAVTGTEMGGAWSPLATLPSTSSSLGISVGTGISCVAFGQCEAVGVLGSATGSTEPFTAASVPPVTVPPVTVQPLTVATTSLPAAQVGTPYDATLQAAGGSGNNSWSIGPGALPAGLTLNASTGVISGTPTASGQSGFVVTDADGGPPAQTASAGLSITVAAQPTTSPTPVSQPTTPVTPSVKVVYLHTSGRKVTAVLTCANAACTGKVAITAVERRNGKKVMAVVAIAKKAKTNTAITLATSRYSIAAGGARTIVLTLSKGANKLLGQLHTLSGQLDVTPAGASHPAVIKIVKFTSTTK